jgi:membrane protein involved in colicin uptake
LTLPAAEASRFRGFETTTAKEDAAKKAEEDAKKKAEKEAKQAAKGG